MTVGLVLVSHVDQLAEGVRALAAPMAPDVPIATAGGSDEDGIGTSFAKVMAGVAEVDDGSGVVMLYDLGSAQMTAEMVLEALDPDQAERVRLVDAPLVEGALAAATAAAGGADLDAVVTAAREAGHQFAQRTEERQPPPEPVRTAAPTQRPVTATAVLRNPAGLHARPTSQLARVASGFDAEVRIGRPGRPGVEATSVLGVVAAGLRVNSEVEVSATGPEARQAVDAVLALIEEGFGEMTEAPPETWVPKVIEPTSEPGVFHGVPAVPGLAVGPVRHLRAVEPTLPPRRDTAAGEEWRRLDAALSKTSTALATRAARGGPDADIAAAHEAMLADPVLRGRVRDRIDAGESAESAWWRCVQEARDLLERGEAYVAERAADVEDLGRAVLAELGVDVRPAVCPEEVAGAVVVAEDLLPSDVTALADAGVEGVALARGGLTAHATVIARGVGLPMAIRFGRSLLEVSDGVPVILDGDSGVVHVDPPASVRFAAKQHRQEQAAERARARAVSAGTSVYADGRRIRVAANVGSLAEAHAAVEAGADGVGLLRTELLYVDRPELPDEEEQAAELAEILAALDRRPVVIRTLDAGGDKMLPALGLDPWRHGPLGERGLRHGLRHPTVLRTQLRAIIRASASYRGDVGVMAPMVTVVAEARAFRDLVDSVVHELEDEGVSYKRPARIGVMVEVPAAALTADEIGAEVDFVSVGSNDLAQYVMAADRTNDAVGDLYQPDHPALWRLYETLIAGARRSGCEVAVCGELAGDPNAARRLVDLGVDELSMAPTAIPDVKAALLETYGPDSRQ